MIFQTIILFENPRDRISFEINTRESFNYNLKREEGKKKTNRRID